MRPLRVVQKLLEVGFLGTLMAAVERLNSLRFDQVRGVETKTNVPLTELQLDPQDRRHAVEYEASRVGLFRRLIRSLDVRLSDYVFIDFGSGKGRALLLAAEFPFRRVIGVEISQQLHEIALRNVKCVGRGSQKCFAIHSVCTNATTFPIPKENLVVYLNNPFDNHILSQVITNLELSQSKTPRDVFVIYVTPIHNATLEQSTFFSVVTKRRKADPQFSYSIYRSLPR